MHGTRVTCMPHKPTTCHTCETFARALVKFAFVRARLSAAHAQPWLRAPGQGWLAQPSGLGPVSSRLSLRVVGCHDIVLRLWYGGWYDDGRYDDHIGIQVQLGYGPPSVSHRSPLLSMKPSMCLTLLSEAIRCCHNGNVGVCVLTPDGTTLQIYDPQWGCCMNVCIFERKLLLCGRGYEGEHAALSSRASPASSILQGELVEVLCGL